MSRRRDAVCPDLDQEERDIRKAMYIVLTSFMNFMVFVNPRNSTQDIIRKLDEYLIAVPIRHISRCMPYGLFVEMYLRHGTLLQNHFNEKRERQRLREQDDVMEEGLVARVIPFEPSVPQRTYTMIDHGYDVVNLGALFASIAIQMGHRGLVEHAVRIGFISRDDHYNEHTTVGDFLDTE